MARTNKNKSSIGCLFWIALILLILVIFLFNRATIQNVLEDTDFIDFIKQEKGEPEVTINNTQEPESDTQIPEVVQPVQETEISVSQPENIPEKTVEIEITEPETIPETTKPETQAPEVPKKIRRSNLYFIEIADDGGIQMKKIVRPVYYIDSPLTETIKTLLQGLSTSELNMGLISLIPEQTQLLSISISNGTAFLNFSESFRFNAFGVEGYNAQLKQIVFTTTEFSNVNSVQFLIEGKKTDYMGPEGVYIGAPLSRDDF